MRNSSHPFTKLKNQNEARCAISASAFGLHALTFTLVLAFAHWGLSYFSWRASVPPTKREGWLAILLCLALFAMLSVPGAPLGILKLGPLLLFIFGLLALEHRPPSDLSLLNKLSGTIKLLHLLPLLCMPAMAALTYAIALQSGLSEETLRTLSEDISLLQAAVGSGLFLWAAGMCIFSYFKSNLRLNWIFMKPKT